MIEIQIWCEICGKIKNAQKIVVGTLETYASLECGHRIFLSIKREGVHGFPAT